MSKDVEVVSTSRVTPLHRPCPACGNSRIEGCRLVYEIPEFQVLRCLECSLTFINHVVDDNLGFAVGYEISADPILADKAASDFQRLKSRLMADGVADFGGFRLLDVGCGIGTFLLKPGREGWDVAGLELSPAVAAYAREQRRLRVDTGSVEDPTHFLPEGFEVITMFGVIEHLANPIAAIQECARLLRPGGFLVLQTPTEDGLLRQVGRFLYRATGGLIRFQVKQFYQMGGGHSLCFNRRSIRGLLDRHGFDVLRIDQSTYGLRILLERFKSFSVPRKLVLSLGTATVFGLGRMLGTSNHMTVYAKKRASPGIARSS